MSNRKRPIKNEEDNYLNKRKSLHYGDSNHSSFKEKQEICVQNVKENHNHVTNQYDVQSLGDRDELIYCPDNVTDQSDDQSAEDELIVDHETQLVETSEVGDLHKYLTGCTKNPGHKEFIPVGIFSLKNLPEGYQDNDLYELIKATADLTVRVDVRMISPDRPEVWPETNVPYPFYNMRKSTNLRIGSGRIDGVWKFTDGVDQDGRKAWKNLRNCWCKNCEGSDSPSNVWWEFFVATATHVVFDNIETRHTSLRLFYDREDSPMVSVDKVSVVDVYIEHDTIWLNCVTCDKNLGKILEKMWGDYFDVWEKVKNKYQKSRDVVKLTFIVSHPHGRSKQVSVGHWKDKYKVGDYCNKFTYTTCTCPGSSGATVHCVGYSAGVWFTGLVHKGSLKSGLNHSGAGMVYD